MMQVVYLVTCGTNIIFHPNLLDKVQKGPGNVRSGLLD